MRPRPEFTVIAGPNGAGKSTTIKMILGLVKPTEGTAVINNYDIVSQRKNACNRKNTFSL